METDQIDMLKIPDSMWGHPGHLLKGCASLGVTETEWCGDCNSDKVPKPNDDFVQVL